MSKAPARRSHPLPLRVEGKRLGIESRYPTVLNPQKMAA